MSEVFQIKSISQLHRLFGYKKPNHPSISFMRFSDMKLSEGVEFEAASVELYVISFKSSIGHLEYGRNHYDFEEGTMIFTAPNQIIYPSHLASDFNDEEGWSLFFHPDILYGTELSKRINELNFFTYDVNEALHISDAERIKINDCIRNIVDEYSQNLDQHSHELIVSNLDLLLNYCKRFYDRQFLTRRKENSSVIIHIEQLLRDYFNSEKPSTIGLPSVKYCAEHVNLSPNYLSDLLKKETGKNTKEHIDYYLLNKAKDLLIGTELNISEIAYELGFEQPKSFTKLFKKKTGLTPREFRLN